MITKHNYHAECELYIRSSARGPEDFGVVLKPEMPEWDAWQTYFNARDLRVQASFMRERWASGYTVPARWPADFDPSFKTGTWNERKRA